MSDAERVQDVAHFEHLAGVLNVLRGGPEVEVLPGVRIATGGHVCAFHRSGKGADVLIPYVRAGLAAGDKCICLVDSAESHALHAHHGMDKMYYVIEGEGVFLIEDRELPTQAGDLLVAPDGVPHGVRNTGQRRLLVLAVLAPAP